MTPPVGRLLRTLRSARGLGIEEASARADIPVARMRRLERGAGDLGYLEGIRLSKALDLCPNCFRRLFEAAAEREVLAGESEPGAPPGDAVEHRPASKNRPSPIATNKEQP